MKTQQPSLPWKVFVFRCLAAQNIAIMAMAVTASVLWPSERVLGKYVGMVSAVSIAILVLSSFVFLFIDRKKAAVGFGIAAISLVVGAMFPAL